MHGVRPGVHKCLPVAPIVHGAVEERVEGWIVLAEALIDGLANEVNKANLRMV